MGVRLAVKKASEALLPSGLSDRGDQLRNGGNARPAELHHLLAIEQELDGPAQPGPVLHLACDRSFDQVARNAGIKDEGVGKFYRLTHAYRVA